MGQDSNQQITMPNMMRTRSLMDTRSLGTVTIMSIFLVPHLGEPTEVSAERSPCFLHFQ